MTLLHFWTLIHNQGKMPGAAAVLFQPNGSHKQTQTMKRIWGLDVVGLDMAFLPLDSVM